MNLDDKTNVSGMPDPLTPRPGTGPDQTVINRPVAGRPQILAPQANDPLLPAPEVHQVKRRRTGPILVLIALLAVAVLAALAAAYSQLGRDETAALVTEPTTTVPTTQASTTAPPTTVDPNALQVVQTEDPFICDGETRPMGLISQAEPNEEIAFSSPQAESLSPGQAGADGTLPIRWQCDGDQIGQVWNLTAAGVTSGKVAIFVITGAAPGTEQSNGTSTPITAAPGEPTTSEVSPPASADLIVDVTQNPFVCNSQAREFATLSGAEPNEEIAFTSPQASGISPGNADVNGERAIRWSCNPDQVGTTWELTATGQSSGRSVTFTFTGS